MRERALAPCQCLLSKHQAFTVQLRPDSWSGSHQWAWQQISVKALWRSHSKNLHRQTLDIPAVQQTSLLHPGTDQYWTMLSLQLANFWTTLFGKHSEKSFICDLGTIPWQVQNLFRRTGNLVNCALSVCSKKKKSCANVLEALIRLNNQNSLSSLWKSTALARNYKTTVISTEYVKCYNLLAKIFVYLLKTSYPNAITLILIWGSLFFQKIEKKKWSNRKIEPKK